MIFPFPTPVYVVGAAGFWLKNGAYSENEKQRLFLFKDEAARLQWGKSERPLDRLRANLRAMRTLNEGIRFRRVEVRTAGMEPQLTA